jgi:hypothetical protein
MKKCSKCSVDCCGDKDYASIINLWVHHSCNYEASTVEQQYVLCERCSTIVAAFINMSRKQMGIPILPEGLFMT